MLSVVVSGVSSATDVVVCFLVVDQRGVMVMKVGGSSIPRNPSGGAPVHRYGEVDVKPLRARPQRARRKITFMVDGFCVSGSTNNQDYPMLVYGCPFSLVTGWSSERFGNPLDSYTPTFRMMGSAVLG